MNVVAMAGGVGGAKLADGIAQLGLSNLTIIVNTGDDFQHFGLFISPDLDTVCYNLAGLEKPDIGWGRAGESWETLSEIQRLGGPDWFSLGNKDLATHLERTRRLMNGETLSQITADFCRKWGIKSKVLPMSDDPVPTIVQTNQGELSFQDYFVRQKCEPEVKGFLFQGVETVKPTPGLIEAINQAELIVICPSNPWVSIDPILAIPGIRSSLKDKVVIGVSPLIGGKAVKGPAAKMYQEMGMIPSARAVADHYGNILDGFVIDNRDHHIADEIKRNADYPITVFETDTWMKTKEDRVSLASQVLEFGQQLIKEV